MNEPWLSVTVAREADLAEVPVGFGAVGLFDGQGQCSLLAATGDMRGFCTRRSSVLLGAKTHDAEAMVRCLPRGSMFEAELAYLHAARAFMPQTSRSITDRWRSWYLRLDLEKRRWSPCSLEELQATDTQSVVIGPMSDKHAPNKLGEILDDVFDLCRYPTELAKTPHGKACAYHEMGRCPAPCQGLEAWDSFTARFGEAAAAAQSMDALLEAINERMNEAALEMDFERAHDLQSLAQRLQSRGGADLTHICDACTWALIAVVPQAGGGARLYVVRANGIRDLGSVARTPDSEIDRVLETIEHTASGRLEPPYAREGVEEGWLACRRLFRKRRAESYLTRAEALEVDTLLAAVRREPPPVEEEADSETRAGLP